PIVLEDGVNCVKEGINVMDVPMFYPRYTNHAKLNDDSMCRQVWGWVVTVCFNNVMSRRKVHLK
ncbi:MAG: hypothetical protein ABSH12_07950, partial [Endomicrobiales bacterium]